MYETARAGRGRRGQSAMTFIKFGARVRGKRKELGYTQAKLAELCEVSIPFIGHIERGTRAPSLESLLTLCNVLRVTPNYLLAGQDLAHPARGRRNAALGGMTDRKRERKVFLPLPFSAVCSM